MKAVAELIRNGRWGAAEARLAELRAKSPFDPQLLFSLSYVLGQQGRLNDAIVVLRQCLGASPAFVQAHVNMSVLLMRTGDPRQAIQHAQMAVRTQPADGALHYHLSLVWKACRNSSNALEVIDNALGMKPGVPEWMMHRMRLLTSLRRGAEAAGEAERLRRLPGFAHNPEVLHSIDSLHAEHSDWAKLAAEAPAIERALRDPSAKINPTSFMTQLDDPGVLHELGVRSAAGYAPVPRPARRWSSGRIVIGYCTADVREHPVAHMLLDILPLHDRERFEVVLVRLSPGDRSEIGGKVASLFDREVDLSQSSDGAAVREIQAAGIDVLVDLMGLTMGHRMDVLAMRPCSTQLLWLGCPVSTGCAHYDGFILDEVVAPAGYEAFCSEPLVRLPCCYHPISPGLNNGVGTAMRERLGIPSDCTAIGLLQQPNRIRPRFIEAVARAVAPHLHAHVVIRMKPEARERAQARFAEWGIAADRVHFVGHWAERSDYLAVIRELDLLVDSHPYGGHSTVGEALSLGTPVLVSSGGTIHSRVAASMLRELGLADLVVPSPERQAGALAELLGDPVALPEWKRRFAHAARQPAGPRHARLVRELERTYAETLSGAAAEHGG